MLTIANYIRAFIRRRQLVTTARLDLIGELQIEGIDTRDYPDFCDAYVSSAEWTDLGIALTDKQLDQLNEYHPEYVYEAVLEQLY